MKFIKIIFSFFFLSFCFSVLAQEDIKPSMYLDENIQVIEPIEYLRKTASFLYFDKVIEKDSIIIHKLNPLYKFGQLSNTETAQLKQLIRKSTQTETNNNETLIITLKDTRYNYLPYKRYLQEQKKNDKQQKKCKKSFKKFNIETLYYYRSNKGDSYNPENFSWHSLPKAIDGLFFNGHASSMLILKPNGQYFFYYSASQKAIKKLLQNDWEDYIKDYDFAKQNLLAKRNGFFVNIIEDHEQQEFHNSLEIRTPKKYPKNKNEAVIPYKNSFDTIEFKTTNKPVQLKTNCFSYGSY